MYVLGIGRDQVTAWRPRLPGVTEVFHAHFTDHAYPAHTHDAWTLLIIDDGAVRYDLDRHHHGALRSLVTLLPPHVPHDGRSATDSGFRKRVLYLEPEVLGTELIGRAVDNPGWPHAPLRHRIHQLHLALRQPGETWEAQSRLALIVDRLGRRLRSRPVTPGPRRDPGIADRLRQLLDAHLTDGLTLDQAAKWIGVHPTHLVRAFSRAYGMPPHRYLTGRRVELARRLLLAGQSPVVVATEAGFYDQSHLSRHFSRMLGTTPARFARSAGAR